MVCDGLSDCLVLYSSLLLTSIPKVLYAPSDFQDEGNFLSTLTGGREMSVKFEDLGRQLESSKTTDSGRSGGKSRRCRCFRGQRLADIVTKQIDCS